ncbi:hypothetical protein C6Y14_34115 [Streptomyces dioscori]|uniref:Uncharacterized protein n=1 Tax=Streptomyces dioscori TaxID=2109333 RepID=A0A2P8PYI3_9ACTN|nr:hypothetical protein C6Y14_34115 [Streptomyces dioscori]
MRVRSVLPAAVTAIARTVTVAAGRFVSGQLGELTAVVPFEPRRCDHRSRRRLSARPGLPG